MAGHSKWANIQHRNGRQDAKRGKIFTRLIKEITVASRLGGSDPGSNPRLRLAVDKAYANNMPKDTIERATKRGSGELEGVTYEEFSYEVFGPGGIAILVDVMTDNRNRTASEVRSLLTRFGGNLGASGSVSYMFKKQGVIVFEKSAVDEDRLTEQAIELGVEDVRNEGESVVVLTEARELERIRNGLAQAGLPAPVSAEVTMIPQNVVHLAGAEAEKAAKLVSLLEDSDDVQNVHTNMDVDEAVLESIG